MNNWRMDFFWGFSCNITVLRYVGCCKPFHIAEHELQHFPMFSLNFEQKNSPTPVYNIESSWLLTVLIVCRSTQNSCNFNYKVHSKRSRTNYIFPLADLVNELNVFFENHPNSPQGKPCDTQEEYFCISKQRMCTNLI
jgi:hypothetical protein